MSRYTYSAIMLLLSAMVLLSESVMACPFCFGSSNPKVIDAFLTSYYMLSGIPLSIIAIGGVLVYRLNRKLNRNAQAPSHRSQYSIRN